jgi:hypothetical protein
MDSSEHGKESSDFMHVEEFLDRLNDYEVLQKDQFPKVVSSQSLRPSNEK